MLYATVSYDFMYQGLNRENFDVFEMAEVLNKYCKSWQWQFVIPIDDPKSFSFNNISEIVNTCNKTNQRMINIIPLRHKRGKDKFDVIIDRIPLKVFLGAFIEFLQILYIKKITCFIDGCYIDIDKAYFGEHHKLILSPDGYIYPEFEFLEYRITDARIGSWKDKEVWFGTGDEGKIPESCLECEKRASCGLKYLYHMFEEQPNGACKEFYTYMDYAIMHKVKNQQMEGVSTARAETISSISKKELENLLKHGAYDIFKEERDGQSMEESKKFCEENIDIYCFFSLLLYRKYTVINLIVNASKARKKSLGY